MSLEAWGDGGDEEDAVDYLTRRGWIVDSNSKFAVRYEGEEQYTIEAAYSVQREHDDSED